MSEKGRRGRGIAFLALLISVMALIIAVMAYHRTGGDLNLRKRVESLQQAFESARQDTANALERLEELVRGKERKR